MLDPTADLYIVTDLKQYCYCPRISYYERCLPDFRPRTYKMEAGKEAHALERKRAARRSLRGYGLENGRRHFEVSLTSARLGLTGKVDEVVEVFEPEHRLIPVDYKLARRVSRHHRLQLAAYALLLEEGDSPPVTTGYIYLIPSRKLEEVPISLALRAELDQALAAIRHITEREWMPPPPHSRRPCQNCEFRRACNDI
jgi:CRISPR-associated exonuclease Cas4